MGLNDFFFGFWQTRRHQVLGVVREVFVLIVVVASRRNDSNDGQSLGRIAFTQNWTGHFITGNKLFTQNIGIALRSIFKRLGQITGLRDLGHPNGGAFSCRLDDEWQA